MRIESFKITSEFDTIRNDDGLLLEFNYEFQLKLSGVDDEISATLTSDLNYAWQNLEKLTDEENSLMNMWVKNNMELILDETYDKCEKYISSYSYQMDSYEETVETSQEDIFKKHDENEEYEKNVALKEGFTQVCVWPGTTMGDSTPEQFEKHFKDDLDVRVQFLEVIETKPDLDSCGKEVPDTGGRNDIFFAVHNEDVSKFSLKRLCFDIRWVDDVLSKVNYRSPIYPSRVFGYKSW